MSLQKQTEYNKGLFMCRVLSNEAPEYISNLYTHTPSRYANSRNHHLSLPRPRIDMFKTSISFSGAYLWNNLPLTVRSCQSLSSFKRKFRAHLKVVAYDGLWHNTARERETDWGFRVIAIAVTGDDDEVLLSVLRCQLTYQGQVVTNAEARFNNSLRPRKPEGSLGRTAQDVHLDSHTAPELCSDWWWWWWVDA